MTIARRFQRRVTVAKRSASRQGRLNRAHYLGDVKLWVGTRLITDFARGCLGATATGIRVSRPS